MKHLDKVKTILIDSFDHGNIREIIQEELDLDVKCVYFEDDDIIIELSNRQVFRLKLKQVK